MVELDQQILYDTHNNTHISFQHMKMTQICIFTHKIMQKLCNLDARKDAPNYMRSCNQSLEEK